MNDNYITDSTHSNLLYVRPQAAAPLPGALIVADGNQRAFGNTQYAQYHYDPNLGFVNDCLSFAENVARGTDQDSNRAEFRATGDNPQGTARLFGHSDAQNVAIAQGPWAQDEATNPAIGEAYGIGRTVDAARGETPYHIAAVVAKDGSDNVTLEADAGDVGRVTPIFDVYGTVPQGQRAQNAQGSLTFHETYVQNYTSTRTTGNRRRRTRHGPSTGVLALRTD